MRKKKRKNKAPLYKYIYKDEKKIERNDIFREYNKLFCFILD